MRYRTNEYSFMLEMQVRGKWEAEVGTTRLRLATEIASKYPKSVKLHIVRLYDNTVVWSSEDANH